MLHILHEFAVVIVPEDELAGIPGKLGVEPVYDLFDVHFRHPVLLLLIYDEPGSLPTGPLALDIRKVYPIFASTGYFFPSLAVWTFS